MNKIMFRIKGTTMSSSNAAYIARDETPREALVDAAISSISTELMIEVGGVTMHLAAWMDPEHWADDWAKLGIEDPDELLAENEEEE